jgi:Skp family chaperone for outer membrane proteins
MTGTIGKVSVLVLGIAFVASASSGAIAGNWGQNHPRREQVNDRLQNQNRRINRELQEGEITQRQAHQLHREDRQDPPRRT